MNFFVGVRSCNLVNKTEPLSKFCVIFLNMVSGRFVYGSFRLRSVRLRIESIRLRLICQFAYESDVEALNRNY